MSSSFRENAKVSPPPKSFRSIGHNIATIGLLLVIIFLLYAVAHQWDQMAEANERAADARAVELFQQSAVDHVWVRRLGQAYAKGRQDALHVDAETPEAIALANACASISVAAASVH